MPATRQFSEWTGLDATEANGKRIVEGYYLGGTINLKKPEGWIVLVSRLENFVNRVKSFPMPLSADELDIQTFGVPKHFDLG